MRPVADSPTRTTWWAGAIGSKASTVFRRPTSTTSVVTLWDPCFEDANFDLQELLDAWAEAARIPERGVVVDEGKLADAISDVPDYLSGNTRIRAIELLSKQRRIPFKKPRIATVLADRFWQ